MRPVGDAVFGFGELGEMRCGEMISIPVLQAEDQLFESGL